MNRKPVNYFRDNTNLFLQDTDVENLFISEYMPRAKGEHVKVFLYALMYADCNGQMNNEMIARHLGIEAEEVLAAWTYWEKSGLIRKHYKSPESTLDYVVEFCSLKQMMMQSSTTPVKKTRGDVPQIPAGLKDMMSNDRIKTMYATIEKITGRTLEAKELKDILSWVEEDHMNPELITKTYAYCVERKGNNKFNYISAFIKTWRENDITTVEQMEKYMEDTEQRYYQYKRVFKALGLMRNPTEEEKRLMDSWYETMHFNMETVLDACKKTSGISSPNINYVNSILKNWNSDKAGAEKRTGGEGTKTAKKSPVNAVMKAYEQNREENRRDLEDRKAEVYEKIPRIKEIESEMADRNIQISRLMLSKKSGKNQEIETLKKAVSGLLAEKAYLLTDHGFVFDYLDPIYSCKNCKDTGLLDTGDRCPCFAEKLKSFQQ